MGQTREESRKTMARRIDCEGLPVRQRAQLRFRPVEVPGISTRTITDGNPDYLMWISQEAAPD